MMFDFQKLIIRIKRAAKSKKAIYALAAVCFLEPIILPLFPEIIIAPLLLSRQQEQLKTLFIAVLMTLIGSTIAYCISFFFGGMVINLLSNFITDLSQIIDNMSAYGSYLPLLGSITPMPFKVVCLSSGILQIPFNNFILGIFIGRSVRYSLLLMLPRQKKTTRKPTTHHGNISTTKNINSTIVD